MGVIIRVLGTISRLEFEFSAHQHCPAVGKERRRIFAERRLWHSGLRALEIIVVPHIDEVRSELEPQAFGDRKSFHQTEVPILKPWPSKGIPAEISPARHTKPQRKTIISGSVTPIPVPSIGIVNVRRSCVTGSSMKIPFGLKWVGRCRRPDARAVNSGSESERLSRFEFDNAGQLPAPKHLP